MVAAALALVTVLAFLPVLGNGFVDWDDNYLLTENPSYRGLGWLQLHWMFTTTLFGHYQPLTWLTYGLDHTVWGLNPAGYHLTSLALHAANAALLFLVGRRLFERAAPVVPAARDLGAAVAALLWALHPLRVETVAWATERRGVLAGALGLAAVLLYLHAVGGAARRPWLLRASAVTFGLGLLAKASLMTLPAALVVLDVYPLRRLRRETATRADLWLEKTPFLVLALASAIVARVVQVRETPTVTAYGWAARLANVAYGLWFYLVKTVVPVGLSPVYEAPVRPDPTELRFVVAAVGVVALTSVLVLTRRRWPAALAAWTAYVALLLPVSRVVPTGYILAADRYSYLPAVGIALLAGGWAARAVDRRLRGTGRGWPTWAAAAALALALGGLATATWRQAGVWRDTGTLFTHALGVDPHCGTCHSNLGVWLIRRGALLQGLEHVLRAAAIRTDLVMTQGRVGWAFAQLGMHAEASKAFRRELERRPGATDVRIALADALLRLGRREEALAQLRTAAATAGTDGAARRLIARVARAAGAADLARAVDPSGALDEAEKP